MLRELFGNHNNVTMHNGKARVSRNFAAESKNRQQSRSDRLSKLDGQIQNLADFKIFLT